ncbi:MAG TPA: hypothetical protein VF509_13610 [Sphingobium sp.]|jgi:hypothetical protein
MTIMTFPDLIDLRDSPVVTVDGLEPHVGESWREYNDRAIAWIESDPDFGVGETRYPLRRLVAETLAYLSGMAAVIGATLFW